MTKKEFEQFKRVPLREFAGQHDLEIIQAHLYDDGHILIELVPFENHLPMKRDGRGPKPGFLEAKKARELSISSTLYVEGAYEL